MNEYHMCRNGGIFLHFLTARQLYGSFLLS